ncbi:MAG: hypothetical protein ACJ8J0_20180, partial [Longimicrobiaceae bacterium]
MAELDRIREHARQAVARSSLRKVATAAGVKVGATKKFIDGSIPYERNARLWKKWYVRELRDSITNVSEISREEAIEHLQHIARHIERLSGRIPNEEVGTKTEPSASDDPLRVAFLSRYGGFLQRLAANASSEAMQAALAATDEVGGLAGMLAAVGPIDPPSRDPLASARARGAAMKSELLERAGGVLSAGEVAALMGVTPAA